MDQTAKQYIEDTLCTCLLLGTSGCIGTCLDCFLVNVVNRVGLPISCIHFIQGMGHCGRVNIHTYPNPTGRKE